MSKKKETDGPFSLASSDPLTYQVRVDGATNIVVSTSDLKSQIQAAAHQSEAPHLPYDPHVSSEYHAFIRGALFVIKLALESEALNEILLAAKDRQLLMAGLGGTQEYKLRRALAAFDQLKSEVYSLAGDK